MNLLVVNNTKEKLILKTHIFDKDFLKVIMVFSTNVHFAKLQLQLTACEHGYWKITTCTVQFSWRDLRSFTR